MRKSVLTGATWVLGAAMLGAVGVGVAGCLSNSQNSQVPGGIATTSPALSPDEQSAASTLAPQPGSFLSGKTTLTAL